MQTLQQELKNMVAFPIIINFEGAKKSFSFLIAYLCLRPTEVEDIYH